MSEEEVVTGDEAPSGSGHRIKIKMTNEGRVLEEKGPSKGISPLSPLPPPHEGPAGGSVDGKHELNKVETAPETSSGIPASSPGTEPAGSTLSLPLGRADIEHSISSETAEGRNEGRPLCAETLASPESTPASTAPPKKKTSKAKRQRAPGPGTAPVEPTSLPVADVETQQVTEESSSGPSPSCAPPSAPPPGSHGHLRRQQPRHGQQG
ncbi:hypothetical protein NGA_0112000 [Nannochloropsis gaditana CCMP526]|uniref:uncharacterized protein n=1 Tax=Nannochloropsis gaditana (strain CCMP526) TaxID=1093141 RepID=UPI00029F7D57|nr:hypothetical protein NGA_0112000 [Nannochloropsis gaditana CCMP526]EKU21228.1 hypothetical protein NGA_0112000 [Nannochloropsis gaditana CCMP526]|eukprot:XP_005855129.1 hypothetical protein NGA_0112000 [Nannochloropsis gaditana CCMP526]